MPRLITKFKYMKPGTRGKSPGGYARYIATREGVEKIDDSKRHAPATVKQQELISRILRDFPDAKESHEYEDYCREKTVGNATEFIARTLEENMDAVADSKTYADYIATRPRAERFGSHGLFTDDGVQVKLSEVSRELNEYTGSIYTVILSLRREDAARLGFDTGSRWRDFLRSQTQTISENLKIPMDHLRWYAAFHDEGHHPHIHLIAYSSVPGEGYLSDKGIEKMRSIFARDIFSQDMLHTYEQQSHYRDELRRQGRETVADIVEQINSGGYSNSKVENLLLKLSERLSRTSGKKVYGYLKPDVKAIVDAIVAELAKDERIQRLYNLWYEQREDVLRTYTDHFPERIPLEQNKEFKAIRNAVILEAMKIVEGIQQAADKEPGEEILPFSDEPSLENLGDPDYWLSRFQPRITEPEPEDSADITPAEEPGSLQFNSQAWWSDYYMLARKYLHGTKDQKPDYEKVMPLLLLEASRGNGFACYDIGRMYLLGLGCDPDEEEAQKWFRDALEAFLAAEQTAKNKGYIRYRIGKCHSCGHGTEQNYEEAARWFRQAVEEGNPHAAYALAGQCLRGQGVEQSDTEALTLYLLAATKGTPPNAYAQYQLGKMYRDGVGTEVDLEQSKEWFARAYAGFLAMEDAIADDKLYYRLGTMNLTGTGTEADPELARYYFEKAAEEGNSFAEYQLGKIYYFGNGVRIDREKGLGYLKVSAEHGNEYAANLLQVIHHQYTQAAASCAASLIARLGQLFRDQEQMYGQRPGMDRKQRKELAQKKQALGIRD